MATRLIVRGMSASLLTIVLVSPCWALGGKDRVATEGHPVHGRPSWPAGVTEFLNAPSRTFGWNRWQTGTPSDVDSYEFRVANIAEWNHLIEKFGGIQADDLVIVLVLPAEGDESTRTGASLMLGDQDRIDRWFEHLKSDETGNRIYGVHRYDEPPVAMPPTLFLRLRNTTDIDQLKISEAITVKRFVLSRRDKLKKPRFAISP